MAERRSLVIVGSEVVELPSGDALLAHAIDRGNGFVSWTGEATVTPSTSVALVDSTGALLSPTKTYKVAACNIDSSVQRGAVALFVGDGSSFTLKTVYEQGTTSSNVQLYLDAGVPSVSVYGGSGTYRIPYRIEEVPNFGQALSEFGILQRLLDAPSDGKSYVRKDGAWVEATGGGGGGGGGAWTVGVGAPNDGDGNDGDLYLEALSGDVYQKSAGTWGSPVANIKGPPGLDGDDGEDGREVELQKSATHIQWRYVGDPTWVNLLPLTDITGPAGADAVGAATRATVTLASGTGTVAVGKVALLLHLVATAEARIRFYGTAEARTADASRAANVAAPQGSGLLLEFIAVTTLLGAPLTPGIVAANLDSPPTGVIYYNIQPVGGSMSVDLTFLKMEN